MIIDPTGTWYWFEFTDNKDGGKVHFLLKSLSKEMTEADAQQFIDMNIKLFGVCTVKLVRSFTRYRVAEKEFRRRGAKQPGFSLPGLIVA